MHLRDVYSLDEAATRLKISPRRLALLLQRGEVSGERLGGRWFLPAEVVEAQSLRLAPVGRPFAARQSWAILAALEGLSPPHRLAREEHARLRRHAARPLDELAPRLRGRAERRQLILGARQLEEAVNSDRWVLGGAQALRLVGSKRGAVVDLYLPADEFEQLLDATLAVPDATYPNLVAHLVEPTCWSFPAAGERGSAWDSVALLDLYESGSLDATGLQRAFEGLRQRRAG